MKLKREKLLAASLFPIRGLKDSSYSFRVLRVLDPLPNDNMRPIRLQRWADQLWHDLKCPVFPSSRFDSPAFIIPANVELPIGTVRTVTDVPDLAYRIEISDQTFDITPREAQPDERDLAAKMVERVVSDRFCALKHKYWRTEWTLFFKLRPENENIAGDFVNAYRGIKFGALFLEESEPYLGCDIRTKYIGRKSLSTHSQEERENVLFNHLDDHIRIDQRATFIRDNGVVKIPCRYANSTGQTIGDFFLQDLGKTVAQYYSERYPELTLNENDEAVFVQDRNKDTSIAVPSSRLFPVFTTDEEWLQQCSIKPQMTPQERVDSIREFLVELGDLEYAGKKISVARDFLQRKRSVFWPPNLEFGGNEILSAFPANAPSGTPIPSIDSALAEWRNNKMPMLYRYGPFFNEPLPDIVFLYPESMPREVREKFLAQLGAEVLKQTGSKMNVRRQRYYRTGNDERSGASLLSNVQTVMSQNDGFFLALIVLWDRFLDHVHAHVKELLASNPSQCVTERVVRIISNTSNPRQAAGRVRNLSLGILTAAGVQPWVLADNLNYDAYIGIDLLHGRVSYHFLFGRGGRNVLTASGHASRRDRIHETVDKVELQATIIAMLTQIHATGKPLSSIVVHRDGRWWRRERQALAQAIDKLKRDKVLASDCRVAVVEIRKSHFPVRLFTTSTNGRLHLENPLPGTYLPLDQDRVLLSTTGRPGAWEKGSVGRTAGTLLLNLVERHGAFDITDIAEDAYRLTHLNWNAPEIEISVPVTIRWNDDSLRLTLASQHQEEDEILDSHEGADNVASPEEVTV
jgi:hypothetical protein